MNFKKLFDSFMPHGIAIIVFFLVGYIYFVKTFNGYSHNEEDVTQGLLKGTEIAKYTEKDGEFPGWTNSIFSGMPSVLIKGKNSGNQIKTYNYLAPFSHQSYPFKILFLSFIGFYLLMNAFGFKPLMGALASIAFGFATYSISSIEAAHYTKVLAMALMPAIIGSMHLLYNGNYLKGGVTLAFNLALQVYYFHYQITYYTIICMFIMGLFYLIQAIKEKNIKTFIIATLIAIIAGSAGAVSNLTKLKSTSEFAKNTMRGGNDMAKADESVKQKETGKNGLDREYAFSWSYDIGETFTLLIPNFYGGSSREKLSKSSEFYKTTQNEEAINDGLPMYHGSMQFTSGPIYIGAVLIFLFVLGLIAVKGPIKWALLTLTLVSFILGWGRHFGIINNFLFDNLPYYNKFRTPMMAFCIAQFSIPLLGFLGLKEIFDNYKEKQKLNTNFNFNIGDLYQNTKNSSWYKVWVSFLIVGGFCLLMAIAGPIFVDMGGIVDEELKKGGNGNIISILKEDRASLLKKDAFRSFIFIALAFGLIWAMFNAQIKKNTAILLIGVIAAVDLIGVDWRYLSWDDFTFRKGTVTERIPDQTDKQIMSDQDPHYRVFDLTRDPFNNNEGAAFHKMIGGYDPAKLSRYQDLISNFLSTKDYQDKGLDMLNCKYLIGAVENQKVAINRPTANGNAWFIKNLVNTSNAKEEMDRLKEIDNKISATYNNTFPQNASIKKTTFELDSVANIKLMSYHPDTMVYQSNNNNDGYAIFSEIYYDNWKAKIDGKPVDLNKVNYTLRGLNLSAGTHQIVLYFEKGSNTTDLVEKIASWSIIVLMILMIALWIKPFVITNK